MLPPSNLTYNLTTQDDVKLTWSSVYGATAYNVYQITDGKLIFVGKTTNASYTLNNLSEGSYNYVASTLSAEGESGPCAPFSVDVVYPSMAAPATLTSTIKNGNDVVLTWGAVAYSNSYKVYELINGGEVLKDTASSTSLTLANVQAGNHTYVISSVVSTRFGESAAGSQLSFNLTFKVMQAPANLIKNIKNATDFTLSWDASLYATSYKVYKIINGVKVLKSTISGTSVTYINMSPGNYSFEVHSCSTRFGESIEGSTLTMTLDGQVMQVHTYLTYSTANINDITLKWTAASYATSYKINQVIDG